MFCNNCGTKNLENSKFCKKCGELLLQAERQPSKNENYSKVKEKKGKNVLISIVMVMALLVLLAGLSLADAYFGIFGGELNVFKLQFGQPETTQNLATSQTVPTADSADSEAIPKADEAPLFTCGTSTVNDADGKSYGTVLVNDQCWMASNLNVGRKIKIKDVASNDGAIEKWCFEDHDSGCDSGGGLYTWNEAMQYVKTEGAQGICPTGWHIPTDAQIHLLEDALKNSGENCSASRTAKSCDGAGTKLKNVGTSSLIFPMAGFYFSGKYSGHGESANIWSSSELNPGNAWDRLLYADKSTVVRDSSLKTNAFSVRCLKD